MSIGGHPEDSLLVFVEVLDVAFRKSLGSKALVYGDGSSLRKYSSGVLNLIPTFEAKPLFCFQ